MFCQFFPADAMQFTPRGPRLIACRGLLEATRLARTPLSLVEARSVFKANVCTGILLQAYLGHACSDADRRGPGPKAFCRGWSSGIPFTTPLLRRRRSSLASSTISLEPILVPASPASLPRVTCQPFTRDL